MSIQSVPILCHRLAGLGVLADLARLRNSNLRAINSGRGTKSVPGHHKLSNTYVEFSFYKESPRSPFGVQSQNGIEAALKRSAEVEARCVHVEIHGNTVILTGAVSSWPERNAAERAAWSSPGVSKVDNKLSISAAMVTAG